VSSADWRLVPGLYWRGFPPHISRVLVCCLVFFLFFLFLLAVFFFFFSFLFLPDRPRPVLIFPVPPYPCSRLAFIRGELTDYLDVATAPHIKYLRFLVLAWNYALSPARFAKILRKTRFWLTMNCLFRGASPQNSRVEYSSSSADACPFRCL